MWKGCSKGCRVLLHFLKRRAWCHEHVSHLLYRTCFLARQLSQASGVYVLIISPEKVWVLPLALIQGVFFSHSVTQTLHNICDQNCKTTKGKQFVLFYFFNKMNPVKNKAGIHSWIVRHPTYIIKPLSPFSTKICYIKWVFTKQII